MLSSEVCGAFGLSVLLPDFREVVVALNEMALEEGTVCVMVEMGCGNLVRFVVGCHSAGPDTKTCLQAVTLHSSAHGRPMWRTRPRARFEVLVEALTSAQGVCSGLIG